MTLSIIRVVLGASTALVLWHFFVMSHVLEFVRQGVISIVTFAVPFFAPLALLSAALAARRRPKTARVLFVLAGALGLAATSILPFFWPRYVPIALLALIGLAAAEMHHARARTTDEA